MIAGTRIPGSMPRPLRAASFGLTLGLIHLLAFCSSSLAAPDAHAVRVDQALICTSIEERQPVEEGDRFPPDVERLFCWIRVQDGAGEVLTHVWIHEGETRARVDLEIGADHWRAWSSKRILRSWTGSWEVKVLTSDGRVLESLSFVIGEEPTR